METMMKKNKINRYSDYKDSGVKWIGTIPKHWEVTIAKHVLRKLNRPRKKNGNTVICSNHGYSKLLGDIKQGLVSLTQHDYQGVNKGDLLVHGMDAWHGAIAISNHVGDCTSVVHVCDSKHNKTYIAYFLKMLAIFNIYKVISNGVRQNTSDFRSWQKFGDIQLILPLLEEQTRIANFLDDKCAKIDQAIQHKEKLIELLKERKQIIIQNVVTCGLNPDVKMKDSGVDWIGEIPEGWEVKKLGLLANVIDPQPDHRAPKIDPNGLPYLGIRDINADGTININTARTVEVKAIEKQENAFTLKDGDILYGKVGTLGLPKRVILGGERVALSATLVIVQTDDEITSRYLKFALDSSLLYSQIQRIITGATRPALGIQQIRKFMIPFPNHIDIENVVNFLEKKEEQINLSIKSQKSLIKKLKEYKQVLINEVVTGKVKV